MASDLDALRSKEAIDTWPNKRIVVDKDDEGKSFIQTEDISCVIENKGFFHRGDLWCTKEMPADNSIEGDRSKDLVTRDPFPNGVNFRALQMFPDPDEAGLQKRIEDNLDLHRRVHQKHMPTAEDLKRHPSMHRTDTTDYLSVAAGEIYIMTDTDEVLLKPGDSAVVRGVNHAWANKSAGPCMIIGGMVDAETYDQVTMSPLETDEVDETVKNWPHKRAVVGMNEKGKSYTLTTKASNVVKQDDFYTVANLWSTGEMPAVNTLDRDRALDVKGAQPSKNGTIFRSMIIEPEVDGKRQSEAAAKELAEHKHDSDSLDYIFVSQGEVTLITDESEAVMRAGDCVVIKGANHAWKTDEEGMLIGVKLDALPR